MAMTFKEAADRAKDYLDFCNIIVMPPSKNIEALYKELKKPTKSTE